MSDFNPCIVRIQKVEHHPNADTLSIYTVLNEFPVIDKTGKYQVGDLVAYICADAILPDNEYWHWLAKPVKRDKDGAVLIPPPPVGQVKPKDLIVKALKIRGTYSEGLIVAAPPGMQEGDSVVEYFGLTKRVYEEELPERGDGNQESPPKTFTLFKYDLEGLAKYGYAFEEGEPVIIMEKLEGENYAMVYAEDRLWIRSRNWYKKNEPDSHWWGFPNRLGMEDKLKEFPGLVIFFELYGGVKHWKYDCLVVDGRIQRKGRVFDIYDIKNKKFLEWEEVVRITPRLGWKPFQFCTRENGRQIDLCITWQRVSLLSEIVCVKG